MTHLSDRMPEVAHGREAWSPDDLEHLVGCDSCRSEWSLVDRTVRLGGDLDGHLDLEALSDRVSERIAAKVRVRRARLRSAGWFVPLAAAAALLIVFGLRQPTGVGTVTAGIVATGLLPELDLLSENDLELVFDVVPAATNPLEQGIPDVSDLGEEELERLLQTLEG